MRLTNQDLANLRREMHLTSIERDLLDTIDALKAQLADSAQRIHEEVAKARLEEAE